MDKLNLQEEQNCDQSQSLPLVELALGCITLDFCDFLEIRPGMELVFKAPSKYEGVLSLNGRAWARVMVSGDDDQVRLKVIEVCS